MVFKTSVPYRIGLIGGGTDLPYFADEHGAEVINASFKAYTHCEILKNQSPQISIETHDYQKSVKISQLPEIALLQANEFRITLAVLNYFYKQLQDLNCGLSIKTFSDFPPQTGLGGSSAHLGAVLKALLHLLELDWDNARILSTAFQIERRILNIFGGFQDFYPCVFEGAHYLSKDVSSEVQHHQLDSEFLNSLGLDFYLIGNSRGSQNITADLPSTATLQEQKKIARQAAEAWKSQDSQLFKSLLKQSWSMKGINTLSLPPSVFAAKTCGLSKAMTVLAVETTHVPEFIENSKDAYQKIDWH
ncbi:MAG: hypothetical protein J7501_16040 [Bdellovibrio sp.]|nr:hypothetical protein [Bdellovibrio sp.]